MILFGDNYLHLPTRGYAARPTVWFQRRYGQALHLLARHRH
jgi:hypothetical protein